MKVHPRASWRSISGRSESSPWSSRQGHHPSTYARSQRDKRREVNGGRIIINKAEAATGARVRGATQHGATGNIWPGFDPVDAPCETDAKAGGQSSPPEPVHALPVSKYLRSEKLHCRFTATAGSTHGYHVTNRHEIDPAISGLRASIGF